MIESTPLQPELLQEEPTATGPVTCLGMTFADDEERRAYFTAQLRAHLQEPTFRAIEGFPIGADDDILALSDPPYYTACPNPFLPQIIAHWQQERATLRAALNLPNDDPAADAQFATRNSPPAYHREPFATDVSEGKNDPIYNAHSYHTKVPHKAIMRYILHYTDPGDIVFDGFCGTGMTGVAAQLCGDRETVESLGFRVDNDGTIFDGDKAISRLGPRKALLNDLSPAATFIAYNYNTPVDVAAFEREAKRILQEVEDELGWMYETFEGNGKNKGTINYTILSDVFLCSNCGTEVIFWEPGTERIKSPISIPVCHNCGMQVEKRNAERVFEAVYDLVDNQVYKKVKRDPVMLNVILADGTRIDKLPDALDLDVVNQVEAMPYTDWIPSFPLMKGERYYKDGLHLINLQRIDQFFTKRNLLYLARWRNLWSDSKFLRMGYMLSTAVLNKTASLMHNIGLKSGRINLAGALPNVMYIPSTIAERNISILLNGKIKDFSRAFDNLCTMQGNSSVSASSSTSLRSVPTESVDYIFVDPPFGSNLLYSELNEIWEAWIKVRTSALNEAVISNNTFAKKRRKGAPKLR